jgi:hypothetical protein
MPNKLPYFARFLTALLFLFVIHGFTSSLYSQIVLNDNRTKEILFSDQNDRVTQSGITISLNNYSSILSSDLNIEEGNWRADTDTREASAYYYTKNSTGLALPGNIRISGIDDIVENAFSLKNASSDNFGTLNVSTDFVITNAESSDEISLVLRFKNSEGTWTDAGRGVFYPDTDQNEQTFSIQITISDIFVQQDDVIDLMWVNRSGQQASHQLYTQRIEVTPQYSELYPFERGGLLISELMPVGNIDGFEFEYIELFNPDSEKKSLKGLSIQTDYGYHTIQNDIEIPPYGYYIVSNADFSDVQGVDHSYFYSSNRLFSGTEPNGRVEILQSGEVIASAVYESAEKNVSFEIERMSQSVDGYTGLQNLNRSGSTFTNDVYGSPGSNGSSLTVYHNTFTGSGVYLITLPGYVYSNMPRIEGASFYSVSGDPVQLPEIEPFEPVFMIKDSDEPLRISVEGINTSESSKIRIVDTGEHRYISPVKPGMYRLGDLFEDRSLLFPTVVGVWDTERKRVDIIGADEVVTEMWKPVISRVIDDEAIERSVSQIPFNADNTFRFSFFEVENDDETFVDEVWVEINDENNSNSASVDPNQSYFVKPVFQLEETDQNRKVPASVLYANHSALDESGLSYFNITADKNSQSEFSLGIFSPDAREQKNAVLKWEIPENIPEDWTIVLTDRITGQEVDMQLDDSYSFRMQAQPERNEPDNSLRNQIRQIDIQSAEVERFIVRFEPPNLTVAGNDETETPGSIELRQNYPNPFNPTTNITFFLPEDRQVRLGIYNIVGQQVATLIDDNMGAGEHSVVWNASNNPSGIYIVQLETGSRILTRKITLVK